MSFGFDTVLCISERAVQSQLKVLFTTSCLPDQPIPTPPSSGRNSSYLINHEIKLSQKGPQGIANLSAGIECPVIEIAPPLVAGAESTRLAVKLKLAKNLDGSSSVFTPARGAAEIVDGCTITWQVDIAGKDIWALLEDPKGQLRTREQGLILPSSGFLISSLYRICSLRASASSFAVLDKDGRPLANSDHAGFSMFVKSYLENSRGPFLLGESLVQIPVDIGDADPDVNTGRLIVSPSNCILYLDFAFKTIQYGLVTRFSKSIVRDPQWELKRGQTEALKVGLFQKSMTSPEKHDGVIIVSRGLFIEQMYAFLFYSLELDINAATASQFNRLPKFRSEVSGDPAPGNASGFRGQTTWERASSTNSAWHQEGRSTTKTTYASDLTPGKSPWFTANKANLGDRSHAHRLMIQHELLAGVKITNALGSGKLDIGCNLLLEVKVTSFGRLAIKVLEQPDLPSGVHDKFTLSMDSAKPPKTYWSTVGSTPEIKKELEELASKLMTDLRQTITIKISYLQGIPFFPAGAAWMYSGVDTDGEGNIYSKVNYATLASGSLVENKDGPSLKITSLNPAPPVSVLETPGFDKVLAAISTAILSDLPLPNPNALSPLVLFLIQHSLTLPPEQQTIIPGRREIISQSSDDAARMSTVIEMIEAKVKIVNDRISNDWNTSLTNLESAFDSIGRQTDKGMMQSIKQLHQDLTDTRISDLYTVENVRIDSPTLDALRILLESRVIAINRCLTYDVVSFQRDLKSWHVYLTTVHAKCIAVLIMNEKLRLVRAKYSGVPETDYNALKQTVVKDILALDALHKGREEQYGRTLYNGVLAYPSTQLLLKEAAIDLKVDCPTLYLLNLLNSQFYFEIHAERVNTDINKYPYDGQLTDNRELGESGPTFRNAFGFAHTDSHTWLMRGSRFEAHPEGPATWNICRDATNTKLGIVDSKRYSSLDFLPVEFKIIPLQSSSGTDPRVTLLLLNKERTGVTNKWDLCVRVSQNLMHSLAFADIPNPKERLHKVLGRRRRVVLWFHNFVSDKCVTILHDVRATSESNAYVVTNNTVWLNRQRGCIGIGSYSEVNTNLEMTLIFRIYLLRPEINAGDRGTIASRLYQNPATGKLALRGSDVVENFDVYVRVWNPIGIRYNYISTMVGMPLYYASYGVGVNWTDTGVDSTLNYKMVEYSTSQNTLGTNSGMGWYDLKYYISGGDTPEGFVDFRRQGTWEVADLFPRD